jgi:hypothetical protein
MFGTEAMKEHSPFEMPEPPFDDETFGVARADFTAGREIKNIEPHDMPYFLARYANEMRVIAFAMKVAQGMTTELNGEIAELAKMMTHP